MKINSLDKQKNQIAADTLVLVILLLLVFLMAARTPLDSDMWWHLRAGEVTVSSAQPLLTDSFSFTRLNQGWINHSWLSQVGMFLVFQAWGYPGLSAVVALLAVISLTLVYIQLDGPSLFRAFLIVLASLIAALSWTPRPQMASLVLLPLVCWLIQRYRVTRKAPLWTLPIVFLFWGNLHGGYPLGFMVIGLTILGETVEHGLKDQENVLSWKEIGTLCFWCAVSALALLINPNGINIWKIPFQTIGVGALQQFIQEWASPDFHDISQQPFLWLLFLALAAAGLSPKRIKIADLLVLVGYGYLALVSRRNFGPFALATLPVVARLLWADILYYRERIKLPPSFLPFLERMRSESKSLPDAWKKVLNLSMAACLGFVAIGKLWVVSNPTLVDAYAHSQDPAGAVEWIQANHPEGALFNDYNWGGYLIWNLRDYPVFVDGRTDLFGDEVIGQWLDVIQARDGWEKVLDRWDIHLILLSKDRLINRMLPENGWKLLYQDDHSLLFGR